MIEVEIAELRRTLEEWIDQVRAGHGLIITDGGEPVARLTPIDAAPLMNDS